MIENKTLLMINAIPNLEDKLSFQLYKTQIKDVFKKFGGIKIHNWKSIEQLMGNGGIKSIAIFEFPNITLVKEMLSSNEFYSLNDLRKKAYKQEVDLMICESI
jgi:uncharacterized protein (DUF1330 family)